MAGGGNGSGGKFEGLRSERHSKELRSGLIAEESKGVYTHRGDPGVAKADCRLLPPWDPFAPPRVPASLRGRLRAPMCLPRFRVGAGRNWLFLVGTGCNRFFWVRLLELQGQWQRGHRVQRDSLAEVATVVSAVWRVEQDLIAAEAHRRVMPS